MWRSCGHGRLDAKGRARPASRCVQRGIRFSQSLFSAAGVAVVAAVLLGRTAASGQKSHPDADSSEVDWVRPSVWHSAFKSVVVCASQISPKESILSITRHASEWGKDRYPEPCIYHSVDRSAPYRAFCFLQLAILMIAAFFSLLTLSLGIAFVVLKLL